MTLLPSQSALPIDELRSHTSLRSLEADILQVDHLQFPPGEGPYHDKHNHTLFVNLTPRPIHYLQAQDGKVHTGLYSRGDILVTPADTPLFVQWQGHENCLQIRLPAAFLTRIAGETLAKDGDRFTLMPTFQSRNGQLDAIATLLLAEIQQPHSNGSLYLDSLANVLAVQVLRHYGTTQAQLPSYDGGLPAHQLSQLLDYIDARLTEDIRLAALAELLNMSPFHFSRMFKRSMGISPHQYLIQQRVERAKQLLKQTDKPIIEVALDCGFSSHSHLSRQFRQLTGMPPKAYRSS